MLIRYKTTKQQIRNLKPGTVFVWNEGVYILTSDTDVSAVNLETGDIESFSAITEVEEKTAELILKEVVR